MLRHLTIRDLAVVDAVDIDCKPGMTALTGETGAGKSILVDALALLVGARASAALVREGAARAEVCGVFDVEANAPARAWLTEHALEDDSGECIVRRSIDPKGRSRIFVNERPLSAQGLRALGENLVDIHGQHAHHLLLHRDRQRDIVDAFADHEELLERVAHLAEEWRGLKRRLADLDAGENDPSRLEFLRFQIDELDAAAIAPGEAESLVAEQRRLANAEGIIDACRRILLRIEGGAAGSIDLALAEIRRDLDGLARHEPRAAAIGELIEGASIGLTEAAATARELSEGPDIDPERLAWTERRLGLMHDLARKHRVKAEELPAIAEGLRERIAHLDAGEERRNELCQAIDEAEERYRKACADLSASRRSAGDALAQRVSETMRTLGMSGGDFSIAIEAAEEKNPSPHGMDRVEFLVSGGAGQSLRPLAKVASGGELSRISLAIQVSHFGGTQVPTLVFDEVDVGIGGRVAEIVGKQLRKLGESRQVLCVTHLPQVAACAHGQSMIEKSSKPDGAPGVNVITLDEEKRVDEIARMLGGEKITPNTLAHAREMLNGT
ncbi:MAG: DNA repair protein RecN [Ectothiorhodospiraceae bacterium AqS1]|nr:DNA repair protein RecN [Ectothiorhodospiraceae bacterium AqS1]